MDGYTPQLVPMDGLRERRTAIGITAKALAAEAQCSMYTVLRIENGLRVSPWMVEKIDTALRHMEAQE